MLRLTCWIHINTSWCRKKKEIRRDFHAHFIQVMLTVDTIMTGLSCPWNSSTDPTLTSRVTPTHSINCLIFSTLKLKYCSSYSYYWRWTFMLISEQNYSVRWEFQPLWVVLSLGMSKQFVQSDFQSLLSAPSPCFHKYMYLNEIMLSWYCDKYQLTKQEVAFISVFFTYLLSVRGNHTNVISLTMSEGRYDIFNYLYNFYSIKPWRIPAFS